MALEKLLADLNDGEKTLDDVTDAVALNNFANANPEFPLAGDLRSQLHSLAASKADDKPKRKRSENYSKRVRSKKTTKPKVAPAAEKIEDTPTEGANN